MRLDNRPLLSPLEQQKAARTHWRQRGFWDAMQGRERLEGSHLSDLGGELAVIAYREGYRTGQRERERVH